MNIFFPSLVDKQAKALIEELKEKGILETLGFYIIKNGEIKAAQECVSKRFSSESVCKKTVALISQELNAQSSHLINRIKNEGKQDEVINYIRKNGADKATGNYYQKGYAYKLVYRNVIEIAMKERASTSFKKKTKKDGSIYLTPSSGKYR